LDYLDVEEVVDYLDVEEVVDYLEEGDELGMFYLKPLLAS
jgi:hypothetical protein